MILDGTAMPTKTNQTVGALTNLRGPRTATRFILPVVRCRMAEGADIARSIP